MGGSVRKLRMLTGPDNDTGHATPQAEETFARGYLVSAPQDSSVRCCRRARVENLHSGLAVVSQHGPIEHHEGEQSVPVAVP